jgi:rubrerythrin
VNLEEAIQTAIDYEIKIRDVYREAFEKIHDGSGRRIVQALAEDEQQHVAYLESKLEQCRKNGTITLESLKTVIPSTKQDIGLI